jgi:hypothetical protein
MDLETDYSQARRQLDELHKEYRFAEENPEFVPKKIRDEGAQIFSDITVYPGTGLTSLKRSSDWYATATLTDASVTLTSREDKNDSKMEIPYSGILNLAYERSADATAWPLPVNRHTCGML